MEEVEVSIKGADCIPLGQLLLMALLFLLKINYGVHKNNWLCRTTPINIVNLSSAGCGS